MEENKEKIENLLDNKIEEIENKSIYENWWIYILLFCLLPITLFILLIRLLMLTANDKKLKILYKYKKLLEEE